MKEALSTRWSRWKLEDGHLAARGRYLPGDHAFGDLVVKIEVLVDGHGFEFYVSVLLDGVHPHLGEEGWRNDGVVGFKCALQEAITRTDHIAAMLRKLTPPTKADLLKLRRSYTRAMREVAAASKGKRHRLKRPNPRRRPRWRPR